MSVLPFLLVGAVAVVGTCIGLLEAARRHAPMDTELWAGGEPGRVGCDGRRRP